MGRRSDTPSAICPNKRLVYVGAAFVVLALAVDFRHAPAPYPEYPSDRPQHLSSTEEPKATTTTQLSGSASDHPHPPVAAAAPDPAPSTISALLVQKRFVAAVELYDDVYMQRPTPLSQRCRELLLDHASNLAQDSNPEEAIELLRAYLEHFYADVEALILIGAAYRDAGFKFEAIKSLKEAYHHEQRPSVSSLILSRENTVIGEYSQELRDNNDTRTLVSLYEWLTSTQPDVSGYHVALANAYASEQRYAEAVYSLRYVQYDTKVGAQARSLLSKLRTAGAVTAPAGS